MYNDLMENVTRLENEPVRISIFLPNLSFNYSDFLSYSEHYLQFEKEEFPEDQYAHVYERQETNIQINNNQANNNPSLIIKINTNSK